MSNILSALAGGLVVWLYVTFREEDLVLANVQELTDSVAALGAKVDALIAKQSNGIDPAQLDPIKAAIDAETAKVDAALGQ